MCFVHFFFGGRDFFLICWRHLLNIVDSWGKFEANHSTCHFTHVFPAAFLSHSLSAPAQSKTQLFYFLSYRNSRKNPEKRGFTRKNHRFLVLFSWSFVFFFYAFFLPKAIRGEGLWRVAPCDRGQPRRLRLGGDGAAAGQGRHRRVRWGVVGGVRSGALVEVVPWWLSLWLSFLGKLIAFLCFSSDFRPFAYIIWWCDTCMK